MGCTGDFVKIHPMFRFQHEIGVGPTNVNTYPSHADIPMCRRNSNSTPYESHLPFPKLKTPLLRINFVLNFPQIFKNPC